MDNTPSSASLVRIDDPEALSGAIQGAALWPVRLAGGAGSSELARLVLPGACLDFARIGSALLVTGAMTEQAYTLIFILDCPETAHAFNFSTAHNDGYIGFFPPGGLLDAVTPAGYSNVTLTIPIEAFLAAAACHCPEMPDFLLTGGAAMRIPPADQIPLRKLAREVYRLIAARADFLADPRALYYLEQEVLDAFFRAFRGGCDHLLQPPPPRVLRRHRRLREAREMIEAHLDSPLSTPDLAAAVGLSTRGLEILFHDLLGISPAAFLKNRRLHAARRALVHSENRPGLVKEVAFNHGFWHLGRFASSYRELFGVYPSDPANSGGATTENK